MKAFQMNEHITKYRFGNPINTQAVLTEGKEISGINLEYFDISIGEELKLQYDMKREDIILGLGENQRGINKRGGFYESFCTDEPLHTAGKKALYGAHNFIVVDGPESFGIFIDFPGKVSFDVGFTHKDKLEVMIQGTDADIYILKGKGLRDITRSFLKAIGQVYAPPKWAFGYQQSRWGYETVADVEKIANSFMENDIPCDSIYLDIDYMQDFKDFTVNEERFPSFGEFVGKMKAKGFRLVPIIDAGVKIEKDYEVYEEGVQKGYFCMDAAGEPFVAAVWPGKVHFPDFLNEDAQRWFGSKYKDLIDCGIEGFWNDMNEPAIFYSEKRLTQAIQTAKQSENKNLDIYSYFKLKDAFSNLSNSMEDYSSFYHNVNGEKIRHDKVHNLYGFYMTKAAAEGFKEIKPNERFLLFSRASYIGMHRYSGIWTGDNNSWWEHLLLNLKMMPSINMCGFLYSGADTGGFGGDANGQLLIRWMQLSLFTPLFRNHTAIGHRKQEPFAFDEETTNILRAIIKLRYSLIPYIYSEYMKALHASDVYISTLSFEYGDEMSRRVENQLLVGDSLMICPVYEENAVGRYVWLPEDMLLWKHRGDMQGDYSILRKGHQYLEADLNETPMFIRKNKMLILGKSASNVEALPKDELFVIAFVESKAS
ncbi:MAG TPA: TIM-barrel domain-containing protein, partial [Patescibacteria group bacterium]|nr:TIM-barrel domain-containing protein [Patescibacteria group bacterium]